MDKIVLNNQSIIQYLVEFHATRDYFECHEIMEEYWKSTPENDNTNLYLAFIQVAVAQYHDRRNNKRGAKRMYSSAYNKLQLYTNKIQDIDLEKLCSDINLRLDHLTEPFADINMVINNEALRRSCIEEAGKQKLNWGIDSSQVDEAVINRHLTRDRSGVIREREKAIQFKQKKREEK